jgi:creatinine amidohydrolase
MNRYLTCLTAQEVGKYLTAQSVLCLPIGSVEQHGPHLPLNTDVILAEEYTKRLVDRWGERFDLWQLPTVAVGLAREHAWAPGTLSLSIQCFTGWLHELSKECVRAFPARRLVIINGHGGNRGVLETLIYELEQASGIRVCVIHPSALARTRSNSTLPEVHAGKSETSVMMALAPDLVRLDQIKRLSAAPALPLAERLILDRGASWAWTSDQHGVAAEGVIGDAAAASVELGREILENAIKNAEAILQQLTAE